MRYQALGDTGLTVSEFGFGGIPLIRLDMAQAERVVRHALDRGVTLFDTAKAYVDSEEKIGRALAGRRHEVVLATKTQQRLAGPATEELERSLRLLRVDAVDLYQFHQISQEKDFQTLTGPGGAYEAMAKARDQGKIRVLGVTAHNLDMAVKLVDSGLFATLQFPLNFIETQAADELFPRAARAGMGVLAMKPFAGGMITDARPAFAFLRGHPGCVPLPGFDTVERIDEIVDIYSRPNRVTPEDQAFMDSCRAELGTRFCRRCEYCQPCPNGVRITPAMMFRVASIRMSPAKAVAFAAQNMETVRACTACGECLAKCPYGLPIPDMLAEHLALYDRYRRKSQDA